MFDDGVDFEEEPVWRARERTVRAAGAFRTFVSTASNAVKSALQRTTPKAASRARASQYAPDDPDRGGQSPGGGGGGGGGGGDDAASDAWTQMISPDSREIWWFNPVLELSSWSDPRTDPGATLYDARPT